MASSTELTLLCKYMGVDPAKFGCKFAKAEHFNDDVLINSKARPITGFVTILLHLSGKSQLQNTVVGRTLQEQINVREWLEYRVCYLTQENLASNRHRIFRDLNETLKSRTYFASNQLTLADAVIYHAVYEVVKQLSHEEKEKYNCLSRWFNHVQQNDDVRQGNEPVIFSRRFLYS